MTTINDLKKEIAGGLRKNKFLVELPWQNLDGMKFNCLCTSLAFPQRTGNVVTVSYRGRKVNMRSETDFGSEIELTIVDDSNFTIRKMMDSWMSGIDPGANGADNQGAQGAYGYSKGYDKYKSELAIWQLDHKSDKVYGYVLEDVFPTSIGPVTYSDSELNTLTEYTVTLSYTRFVSVSR